MWEEKKSKVWFWKPKPNIVYRHKVKRGYSHPNQMGYCFSKINDIKIIDVNGNECYNASFRIDDDGFCQIRIYDYDRRHRRYVKEKKIIPVENLKFSKHYIVSEYWGQGGGRAETWLYTVKIKSE